MSLWIWLLLACAVTYATKLVGYLVPTRWLENKHTARIAGTLTIGLLASLTAMNTFATEAGPVIDARLAALVAAVVALALRAPFLLVVIIGAAASAVMRWTGFP